MNKFEKYLKENRSENMETALTDNSYKKAYENEHHNKLPRQVNSEPAAYGDAVLKMVICEILWKRKTCILTEKKKEYETDKVLVEKIAAYYRILEFMSYDKNDKELRCDYNYGKDKNIDKYNLN